MKISYIKQTQRVLYNRNIMIINVCLEFFNYIKSWYKRKEKGRAILKPDTCLFLLFRITHKGVLQHNYNFTLKKLDFKKIYINNK
jgi:hypothetical protein